uniref:Fibronectin type-III domain-containing protein n=2 Tax=Pyxicephalus adspersus TaxID=30357 RepID=A0AAV2ZS37_PYXAD|nr:TPA: hypothetical protein GDO54_002720 [Pyxicephalus adspersus]
MVSTAAPTNASTQSTAAQQTKVTQRKSTPERLLYITSGPEEDYYDYDEETTLSPHSPVPMKPCHYDRCENLSPTCEEIQRKAGGNCLCPGIDGPNIKPDSPAINKVLSGDTEVTVTWCSPSSTVQSYRVLYQGPDSQVEKGPLLNASYRSYSIENLLPGTQYTICVVAINNAGESSAKFIEAEEDIERTIKGPCSNFHTTATKTSHMYIGIGVGLGALMVVMGILGILMCNRKKRKNRMDVEEEEMGVSNHYYKAGNTN